MKSQKKIQTYRWIKNIIKVLCQIKKQFLILKPIINTQGESNQLIVY